MRGGWSVRGAGRSNLKAAVNAELGRKYVECTQVDEFVAVKSADIKDDIVFIAVIALVWRCDPSNKRCTGTVAKGIRLSVELEEKVSDDSCRHDMLLRVLLDGTPFCLQYHFVGVVTVRTHSISVPGSRESQARGGETGNSKMLLYHVGCKYPQPHHRNCRDASTRQVDTAISPCLCHDRHGWVET